MPVPKRKTSKSRRDMRSSCKFAVAKSVASCQTCQTPVLPHQVCYECGYYKGVKVVRTKTDRMHDRGQARREMEARKQGKAVEAQAEQGESKE